MNIGMNIPQYYQYPINLFHGEIKDGISQEGYKFTPNDIEKVVNRERSRIELVVGGSFLFSGFNLWTQQKLEESFFFTSKLMGNKVTIKIDFEGEFTINSSSINNSSRQDSQGNQQLLNVILKSAMCETGLLQFGNRNRFFDASAPIQVPELDMQIWGGFKLHCYKYDSGCNVVVDSCARFMSTKSVFD